MVSQLIDDEFLEELAEVDEEDGLPEWFEEVPEIPTIDGQPAVVDYSIRGPKDWVVSGPLEPWQGRGRQFPSEAAAYRWAVSKFGTSRVSRIYPGPNRWAFLIKYVEEPGVRDRSVEGE